MKEKPSQPALSAGPRQRNILIFSGVYIDRFLLFVLAASLVFTAFVHLSTPVEDYDFFWHLKTGEHIWQNKELPSKDPFSYTTPPLQSSREQFILKGYWLTQLVYFLSYSWGGFSAIVLLRFFIVGLLIYFMTRQREGDEVVHTGLLLIAISIILMEYPMDRPQVFSFIFFAALLYLLKRVRSGADYPDISQSGTRKATIFPYVKSALPVSLLMVAWANMHGAALLGQVTILLFVIMEGVKFIHPSLRPAEKKHFSRLLVAGFAGLGLSLLNPNTYHAVIEMVSMPDYMRQNNTDYLSTIEVFRADSSPAMPLYWLVLLLTAAVLLLNLRRFDITELALVAGTGYFSFTQRRYIAFFLITAIAVAARYLSGKKLLQTAKVFIVLVALFTGVFFGWKGHSNIRNLASGRWLTDFYFPLRAADFIVQNDLKGNMYNYYNWGGFLIWKLSPERKVFIDGRVLNGSAYSDSTLIDSVSAINLAGMPVWKALLQAYNVKYLLIPVYQQTGEKSPLVSALLKEDKWVPVFSYGNSIIFVRDSGENTAVIEKFGIPKETFTGNM